VTSALRRVITRSADTEGHHHLSSRVIVEAVDQLRQPLRLPLVPGQNGKDVPQQRCVRFTEEPEPHPEPAKPEAATEAPPVVQQSNPPTPDSDDDYLIIDGVEF
jgi:hypothetical protein